MDTLNILVVYPAHSEKEAVKNARELKELYEDNDVDVTLDYFVNNDDSIDSIATFLKLISSRDSVFFTGGFRKDVTCMNEFNIAIRFKHVIYDDLELKEDMDLREEEEETLNEGLSNICEVLSDRLHEVLHDRMQENDLTCSPFRCDKCPFRNVDNFANWLKKQRQTTIFDFLEEENKQ